MRALVVMGSPGSERQYGLTSARRVVEALRSRNWEVDTLDAADLRPLPVLLAARAPDVVVPVGFGLASGEDGTVRTICDVFGVPCAGPSRLAGIVGTFKHILDATVRGLFAPDSGIEAPRGDLVRVSDSADVVRSVLANLHPPFVLKPTCGGSSVGLEVASSVDQALVRLPILAREHGAMLVQSLVTDCREVTVTLMENEVGDATVLPVIEILRGDSLVFGSEEKFGSGAESRHRLRPNLPEGTLDRISIAAMRLWTALDCRGLMRMDVLVRTDGRIVILEVNPLPGMLSESLACDAARAAGIQFEDLAEIFATSGLRRDSLAGA